MANLAAMSHPFEPTAHRPAHRRQPVGLGVSQDPTLENTLQSNGQLALNATAISSLSAGEQVQYATEVCHQAREKATSARARAGIAILNEAEVRQAADAKRLQADNAVRCLLIVGSY